MYFLEMWLRIRAIKEDSNLTSEIKSVLIKKANIFSKNLLFNKESITKQLKEGNIGLARIEFGLAAAFNRSTVSATAKLIDESSTTRKYYVYGFVGDKVKFRSDDHFKGIFGWINPIGVEWPQSRAIATTNVYVEFQMEVEVDK